MSNNQSEMTKEYQAAFRVVRSVFLRRDPAGLGTDTDDGPPEDEYDMEIARILPLFNKNLSDDALAMGVEQVFVDSFGYEKKSNPFDVYGNLINDIRSALTEAGLTRFLKNQ